MQTRLIQGDSLNFVTAPREYSAAAGWTLVYTLVPRVAGPERIEFSATVEGEQFRVAVASSVTAGWAPGEYAWSAAVTQNGERYTVETGSLTIVPDPSKANALDLRSQARKAIDDLMAARATWVSTNGRVKRYSIAGRDMEFKDAAELDRELSFWRKQLGEEELSAGLEAGLRPKNRLLTRFVRPS